MKTGIWVIFLLISCSAWTQSHTDELIQTLKLNKTELEKFETYSKFCPTCELNQAESFGTTKSVLESNHNIDDRSTYYFNFNEDHKLESVIIAGFKGLIDEHYKYLMKYGLDNGLVSKRQAEQPGSTNFTVNVKGNRFNCLLVKRLTSKGMYIYIKFTYIAVPDF